MKTAVAILLLGCAGFGMALRAGTDSSPPSAGAPLRGSAAAPPKADDVAWGKEVGGLQAGVGPTRKTYRAGETVTMVVKLRNVGKAPVTYTYLLTPYQYVVPTVHDSAGKPVTVEKQADVFYAAVPTTATLKPGEEVVLGPTGKAAELPAQKAPGWHPVFGIAQHAGGDVPVARVGPGKYTASYSGLVQSHPTLATGFTGFEVEGHVAWGKEVDGLQAGLDAGGMRSYRVGDTVRLRVRLRNVGKSAIDYTYQPIPFRESVPRVTGADGTPAKVLPTRAYFSFQRPVTRTLKPGEEINFGTLSRSAELTATGAGVFTLESPGSKGDEDTVRALVTPGLYTVGYSSFLGSHPSLGTGTVDIEVKEPPPAQKDRAALVGMWTLRSTTSGGKQDVDRKGGLTFRKDTAVINIGESLVTADYRLSGDKSPAGIDITHRSIAGVLTFEGIYELDGDTLTLCFGPPGTPRPTVFSAKPGESTTVEVYRRVK